MAVDALDVPGGGGRPGRARWRRLVADPHTGTLAHVDDHVLHPPPDRATVTDDSGTTDPASASRGRAEPRAVATDPRLTKLLTGPVTPTPAEDGTRYRPSRRLRRHVHTRDATCIGPACFHPATRTQVDHTINHGERDEHLVLGTTSDGNLGSTCERVLGRQDPRRLAAATTRTRHLRLDLPHRPHLPRPSPTPAPLLAHPTTRTTTT